MSEVPDEIPGLAQDLRGVASGSSPDQEGNFMTRTCGNRLAGLVLTSLCATASTSALAGDEPRTRSPVMMIGPATVVDANHLRVRDTTVRLAGIEAPSDEWCRKATEEGCAAKAAKALRQIIGRNQVWCRQTTRDGVPRFASETPLARCQVVSKRRMPVDMFKFSQQWINYQMVKAGWAIGFPWLASSNPITAAIAKESRKVRRRNGGMWRYDVVIPETARVRTENPNWIGGDGRQPIQGIAEVLAGDRIQIGSTTVGLAGIEAPRDAWCEHGVDECSAEHATQTLAKMIRKRPVSCTPVTMPGSPAPGDVHGFCTLRSDRACDQDECWLNWRMIHVGAATARRDWADRHKAMHGLILAESNAILGERGMWSGQVTIEPREGAAAPFHMPGPLHRVTEESLQAMADESLWLDHELHLGELLLYGIYGARKEWCRSRSNRRCADEAREAIKAMTDGTGIECTWPEEAHFKRSWKLRAVCTTAEHRERQEGGDCEGIECSINFELVRQGWAVQIHYPRRRSNDRVLHQLLRAEHAARDERVGIWTGRVKLSGYVKELRELRSKRHR